VDLTFSYLDVMPDYVLRRYEMRETRNAAVVLAATNPDELREIVDVLDWFDLTDEDLLSPGGNKSITARALDDKFRELGWREGQHNLEVTSVKRVMPWRTAGEKTVLEYVSTVQSESYKVDNLKGRVALDVEWNAKDGNLDRDLSAYRALYQEGVIDGAVIITRTQSIRELAAQRGADEKKFDTSTTTNLEKLEPRLTRGDPGGCPVLAVAISPLTYRIRVS